MKEQDKKRPGITEELMPSKPWQQKTGRQKVDEDYRVGVEESHAHPHQQQPVEPRPKFTGSQRSTKRPLDEKKLWPRKKASQRAVTDGN
jgi:hypothetical protein